MFRNHPEVVALAIITLVLTLGPLAGRRAQFQRNRIVTIAEPSSFRVEVDRPTPCEITNRILRALRAAR